MCSVESASRLAAAQIGVGAASAAAAGIGEGGPLAVAAEVDEPQVMGFERHVRQCFGNRADASAEGADRLAPVFDDDPHCAGLEFELNGYLAHRVVGVGMVDQPGADSLDGRAEQLGLDRVEVAPLGEFADGAADYREILLLGSDRDPDPVGHSARAYWESLRFAC